MLKISRPVQILLFVLLLLPILSGVASGLFGGLEGFECWCRQDTTAASNVVSGRFIKIAHSAPKSILHLSEVQVFSTAGGPNVAAGKSVTASSLWTGVPVGNITDGDPKTIAHTSGGEAGWFIIDLGAVLPINNIRITNRIDCCKSRTTGAVVSILDANKTPVYTATPLPDKKGLTVYQDLGAANGDGYSFYDIFPPSPTPRGL